MSCSDVSTTSACQSLVTCKNDEVNYRGNDKTLDVYHLAHVCYLHKYITEINKTRYDMGCTYAELCLRPTGSLFGKRSDHSHMVCQQCCNNSHVCNADLSCDGQNKGISCLSCSGVSSPATCNHTTTCNMDEVCFMHHYITESGQEMYDLGCKRPNLCASGNKNIFGKRLTGGNHFVCDSCCNHRDYCNRDAHCRDVHLKSINASCTSAHECISNLACIYGACQCQDKNYYWTDNECHKKKGYNESCNGDVECSNTLFCVHNKCKCDFSVDYLVGTVCKPRKHYSAACQSSEECVRNLRCENQQCSCKSVEHWTGSDCTIYPPECSDIVNSSPNLSPNGVQRIYPDGIHPISVYCLDGWTVIHRRYNGSVNFNRNWTDYKHGFGTPYGEYWLGNDNINLISTNGHHKLYVEIKTEYQKRILHANYSTFSVGDEATQYKLNITGYSGNAGDAVDTGQYSINGQQFTTHDQDNDNFKTNCADQFY